MNLLFVSYKAPPLRAARAARLAGLGRWLMGRGHRLQVYTVDLGGDDRLSLDKLEGADLVTAPAGPLEGARQALDATDAARNAGASRPLWARAKDAAKTALIPDQQVEWAVHLLRPVPVRRPDVVVSFVPPFTGALVGHVLAGRHGAAHVLDYGDPWSLRVDAVPAWRRAIDRRLERKILRRAAGVIVNAAPAAVAMERRFGQLVEVTCLPSGYDPDDYDPDPGPPGGELRHLGALYGIRLPLAPLDRALERHAVFDRVVHYGRRSYVDLPARFEERAPVPRREALRLMQTGGALLVVGNRGGLQIPSKIYDYLGAGRPILAVAESGDGPLADLELGEQGEVVPNRVGAILDGLEAVAERRHRRFEPPDAYRWERIAADYDARLRAWRG